MSACTFFGHRDCPKASKSKLREILIDLIESHNVDMFYVGHQGAFDALVSGVLRELAQEYPHVQYAIVLAYMPSENSGPVLELIFNGSIGEVQLYDSADECADPGDHLAGIIDIR